MYVPLNQLGKGTLSHTLTHTHTHTPTHTHRHPGNCYEGKHDSAPRLHQSTTCREANLKYKVNAFNVPLVASSDKYKVGRPKQLKVGMCVAHVGAMERAPHQLANNETKAVYVPWEKAAGQIQGPRKRRGQNCVTNKHFRPSLSDPSIAG